MSQWVAELREIVAEQMYVLRNAPQGGADPWSKLSDAAARKRAYRDAESTLAFIVMREACLRAEIEGTRRSGDLWPDERPDVVVETWKQRALAAEAELGLARDRLAAAAAPNPSTERDTPRSAAIAPPRPAKAARDADALSAGHARGADPVLPVPPDIEQKVISDVALIDNAVSLFRSILATKQPDPVFGT